MEMEKVQLYQYNISGYYLAIDSKGKCEKKHFEEIVSAKDNVDAMRMVIGEFAWNESLLGNTFKLDMVHYECW